MRGCEITPHEWGKMGIGDVSLFSIPSRGVFLDILAKAFFGYHRYVYLISFWVGLQLGFKRKFMDYAMGDRPSIH